MTIIIKPVESDAEWRQYFDLRWRVLRAPWGEAEGTEKDDIEADCHHIIACESTRVVGVGRLQFNDEQQAQIRYMAVAPDCEGRGIGRRIVSALEQYARLQNAAEIVLDAREPAVGFYRRLGYEVIEKSYLLFDSIQHWRMRKIL